MGADASWTGSPDTRAPKRSMGLDAVRMMNTPAPILRQCRSSPLLRRACPRRLPYVSHLPSESAYTSSLCRIGRSGCAGLTWDDLQLEHSGTGNRPPTWAHISIAAGNIINSRAFAFQYPTSGKPVPLRDGLFDGAHSRALFLSRARVGDKEGTLVLAPSYPRGGMQGDHVIFRWKVGRVEYMISIHGWEPFTQAISTLRKIVASAEP